MTTETAVKNNVVWFEIPSADFDRAVTFYETIFGQALNKLEFMGTPENPVFQPESSAQPARKIRVPRPRTIATKRKVPFIRLIVCRCFLGVKQSWDGPSE